MQPVEAIDNAEGFVPTIRGKLDQVHPAKLFFGFFKAGKTGFLTFQESVDRVVVTMVNGCLVVHDRTIYEQREFGRYLVRYGIVTEDELKKYGAKARREGRGNPVDMMIAAGILDQGTAHKWAENFYDREIVSVFSWRHGRYQFAETDHLEGFAGEPDARRSLRWIIDGIIEKYHHGVIEHRLEKRLNTPLKINTKSPAAIDELLITDGEKAIGRWIGEGYSLRKIMAESELGPTRARSLVFALLTVDAARFVVSAKQKKLKRRKPLTPEQRAWREVFRAAEASVERIRQEVASEPEGEEDIDRRVAEILMATPEVAALRDRKGAGDEDPTALLKQKIYDRIRELHDPAAKAAPEPEEAFAPDEDLTRILDQPEEPEAEPEPESEDTLEVLADDEVAAFDVDAAAEDSTEGEPAADLELGDLPELEGSQALDTMDDFDRILAEDGAKDTESGGDILTEDLSFSDSDPPDQIYQLGMALIGQEEWARAHQMIQAAIDRGHAGPEPNIHCGWAYFKGHPEDPDRFASAADLVQKGIDTSPKSPLGYLVLGKMYQESGDKSMAELYYVKALEIDHDCAEARDLMRKIYHER